VIHADAPVGTKDEHPLPRHHADAGADRHAGTQPADASTHAGLWSVWVAAAICGAGFLWFRASEMFVGLRTDESLSIWVSSDGIGDTVSRAQQFQGNSPVYFSFLWLWRQLVGDAEVLLRLPSLLAVVATCALAIRFGRELGSTHMGMAAAAVLLTGPGVIIATTAARPYGFLLLFALVSSRALWHWLGDPDATRHGLVWAISLALAVAMSPFAATLGLAHLVALIDHRVKGRPFPSGLGLSIVVAAALTLPLAPQILAFFVDRESFVLTDTPPLSLVAKSILPANAIVIALLASPRTALSSITSKDGDTPELVRFFIAWSVLPVFTLYLAGLVAGSPVFLDRYRIVAVMGGALFVGLIVRTLPPLGKHIAVILLAVLAVWSMTDLDVKRDGWREAFAWAETQTNESQDRILALNPHLVETFDFTILDDPEWTPYLGAHADGYDFDAPRLIVPRTEPSQALLERRISELFAHDVVVVVDASDATWIDALRPAATQAGYDANTGPVDGLVAVAVFTRNG